MSKLTRSVTVDVPVEKLFDFASDPGRLWSSMPDVVIRDRVLTPEIVGSKATLIALSVHRLLLGVYMEGTVEYTDVTPNKTIVARVHFAGESPTWTFSFAPTEGGTSLAAEAEWHVNLPVVGDSLAAMEAKSHESMLEDWLAKVKDIVEAEVKAPTG